MVEKVRSFILKSLSIRVNPLAYIAVVTSLIWGFAFSFLAGFDDVRMSFLTNGNVLPSPHLWGIIMLVASILLVAGMATKKKEAVQYASMIDFVLWSFAMLTYFLAGIWLIPISFALVNLLGFGYIYLASSLNVLWSH